MRFVLDCSVTMSWLFKDEVDNYSESVLSLLRLQGALVPAIWPLEVANVLLTAERRQRVSEAQRVQFTELLVSLPIAVLNRAVDQTFNAILPLAREHKLSSYDASYLELALREGLPLATRDHKLRLAARHCGVPLAGK